MKVNIDSISNDDLYFSSTRVIKKETDCKLE